MVFNPKRRKMMIADKFPCFAINGFPLHFVQEFNYLGHIGYNQWAVLIIIRTSIVNTKPVHEVYALLLDVVSQYSVLCYNFRVDLIFIFIALWTLLSALKNILI